MTDYNLTTGEVLAALVLVQSCLKGMGGHTITDLYDDEYTWVSASDLYGSHGWTEAQCQGFFGSLVHKGFIVEYDRNAFYLPTKAWTSLIPGWDVEDAGGPFPIVG